jgi:hypothetical protein
MVYAKSPEVRVLNPGEVVNKDYFVAGEVIEIYGTVNGDVYAAGGTVLVDGVINGDLLAAGGSVTISGQVVEDVRVAGGQVNLTGSVGGNATLLGGNVDIAEDALVAGSLTLGSGNANVNAPVGKGIMAGVGNLTITSSVGGDVEAAVGNLRLTPTAKVAGSVNYISEEKISVADTASVSGTISQRPVPEWLKKQNRAEWQNYTKGFDMFAKLSSILATLVIGLLMLKFMPNYTKRASDLVTTKFLPSLGIGFVGLIILPILAIFLAITIIGIPMALFLVFVFVVYLYLSRIYAMIAIGNTLANLAKLKVNQYLIFALGLFVYYALGLIPFIGGLITLVIVIASFGAALRNEYGTWVSARKAKVL